MNRTRSERISFRGARSAIVAAALTALPASALAQSQGGYSSQPYGQSQTQYGQSSPGTVYNPGAPPSSSAGDRYDREQTANSDKDSKRGLEFFYANAGIGLSVLGMQTFSGNDLKLEKTSSTGPAFDVGAGLRLFVFTLGPRLRYHQLSAFNLWQITGELGLHIPAGKLDPYFTLSGGYAFVGSLDQDVIPSSSNVSSNDVKVKGGSVGVALGLDYYIAPFFSVGGEVGAQALFLKREGAGTAENPLADSSASVGGNLLFQGHVGFHL